MKFVIVLIYLTCLSNLIIAQGVKIGGTGNPDPYAILDVDGTTGKGLLLPRLSTVQMNALSQASDGMFIYNTTETSLYVRKSGAWVKCSDAQQASSLSLPHTSSHPVGNGYVLDLTNTTGTGAYGAIIGRSPINGNAVVGYSEAGNGLVGSSNSGTGAYLSSSTGAALITGAGNIGFGIVNPNKARLAVTGTVGAVSALFENGTGVAIENNFPGIGLNTYYNNGRKAIGNGYGGVLSLDPNTGDIQLLSSSIAGTVDNLLSMNHRLMVKKNGNIGIQGNYYPQAPFSMGNVLGNKIWLWGYNDSTHYGMGIQPFQMQVYTPSVEDDILFGYGSSINFTENMRIKGNGKVGIGSSEPNYPLTVEAAGAGIVHQSNSVIMGTQVSGSAGWLKTFSNHPLYFTTNNGANTQMALTIGGRLGIGTHLPAAKIHARDTIQELLQLDNFKALAVDEKSNINLKTGSQYTGIIGTTGTGSSSARLSFYTGASLSSSFLTEKMSILNNGNVGINTINPSATLEVNGKTKLVQAAGQDAAIVISGAIGVSGNNKAIFVRTVNNSDITLNAKQVILDNTLTNNKPGLYLFVSSNSGVPVGVTYDSNIQKWKLYTTGMEVSGFTTLNLKECDDDCKLTQIPLVKERSFGPGDSFNILVIQNM